MNWHHVIINGYPRSGKNTFVDFCAEILDKDREAFGGYKWVIQDISSVDAVKQAALLLGWDGEKDAKGRKFLSDIKDLSTIAYDGPLKDMLRRGLWIPNYDELVPVRIPKNMVNFYHIREPQEIKRMKQALMENDQENIHTLLVVRPEVEGRDQSCHADKNVTKYAYSETVMNDGDLDDFKAAAYDFLEKILDFN